MRQFRQSFVLQFCQPFVLQFLISQSKVSTAFREHFENKWYTCQTASPLQRQEERGPPQAVQALEHQEDQSLPSYAVQALQRQEERCLPPQAERALQRQEERGPCQAVRALQCQEKGLTSHASVNKEEG